MVTTRSCAKKDELIEMPFGSVDSVGPKELCIRWELWVVGSAQGKGKFWGIFRPIMRYKEYPASVI